jgi:hypothetical protein
MDMQYSFNIDKLYVLRYYRVPGFYTLVVTDVGQGGGVVSIMVLQYVVEGNMGRRLENSGGGILSPICRDFIISLSVAQILKELGMSQFSQEVAKIAKSLAGEIALELSTGKYLDGLATRIKEELGTFWAVDIDDYLLESLLRKTAELKSGLYILPEEYKALLSEEILRDLVALFNKEMKEVPTINEVLGRGDPEEVIQTVATALVVGVGGLHGV